MVKNDDFTVEKPQSKNGRMRYYSGKGNRDKYTPDSNYLPGEDEMF